MTVEFGRFAALGVPLKRRVFFSFHYQFDVWRANQVRNSWRYRHENQREAFGFFDGSLWESSRRTGDESLKSLIRQGMDNTSVTCVLCGTLTYSRRWVRYEIARTLVKKSGLLCVQIHGLRNQQRQLGIAGPNPLDHMGLYRADDGRTLIAEKDNHGKWVRYNDYTQKIELPNNWKQPSSSNVMPLSAYARTYNYMSQSGMQTFSNWIATAAAEAGR